MTEAKHTPGPWVVRPTIPITDPRFRWVPSYATDIRRTWRKHRLLHWLQRNKEKTCAT